MVISVNSFNPDSFLDSTDTAGSPPRAWSPLQQAIFEALHDPQLNILVQAVAGSGKTTTLIEALRHAPGSALFMAFNKSIAEDIKGKAPKGDVKTLNALGHRLWMQNSPASKLDFDKLRNIVKSIMPADDFREWGYQVQRMVGMAKNQALDIDGSCIDMDLHEAFLGIADANDALPQGKENDAAIFAARAFVESRARLDSFDFDDQLYMPLYRAWEYPHYDNVFIDECQDLSPVQHLMLEEFRGGGSRVVAVGDRHQAIYGFRGADVRSMYNLKDRFGMSEFPLSISYRCSQNVVKEAQVYCDQIKWRDNAPEGTVRYRDDHISGCDPDLFDRELVVCRNNAPLFRAILRHVRAKSPCRVLSNFLDSFQGFIRGFKVDTTRELLAKIDKWEEEKINEAMEKNQGRGKLAIIRDKAETIRILCQGYRLVSEVVQLVKQLGEAKSAGPTFSTIHKAKGLEAESVYILRPDLVPSPFAESGDAKTQEQNLAYVAITRAKEELTYGVMG
jgi:superfamily I DNA/RNA helicase